MCYDVRVHLDTQLKRANREGNKEVLKDIKERIKEVADFPYYHVTGFKHPRLLIYTNENPYEPTISQWGLAPYWVKNKKQLYGAWNKTLNARGETIFDLKSFKSSAQSRRCLIPIDGFYEHRHFNNNTYPHFIFRKGSQPMVLAGLWREWTDEESGETQSTFTIVTTTANEMMEKIHNNPAASEEPRMPLILPDELQDKWLGEYDEELAEKAISELIGPYPDEEMEAYTVDRLRGKAYKGNVAEITNKVDYPELSQTELF